MKLAWLTDLHLNFIAPKERLAFYQTIVDTKIDAVLVSGDSAEAPSLCDIFLEMVHAIGKPIYFVLGNHDYYRGSVARSRRYDNVDTNDRAFKLVTKLWCTKVDSKYATCRNGRIC